MEMGHIMWVCAFEDVFRQLLRVGVVNRLYLYIKGAGFAAECLSHPCGKLLCKLAFKGSWHVDSPIHMHGPVRVLKDINVGWRDTETQLSGAVRQPVAELVPDAPKRRHGSLFGFVGQVDDNISIQAATAGPCVVECPKPGLRDAPVDMYRFAYHVVATSCWFWPS